jgi:hypothetical protein
MIHTAKWLTVFTSALCEAFLAFDKNWSDLFKLTPRKRALLGEKTVGKLAKEFSAFYVN